MKFKFKTKKVWDDTKGPLAVVAIATTLAIAYLYGRHVTITNAFLEEYNLIEAFYKD